MLSPKEEAYLGLIPVITNVSRPLAGTNILTWFFSLQIFITSLNPHLQYIEEKELNSDTSITTQNLFLFQH